jgi:hypothetical protein
MILLAMRRKENGNKAAYRHQVRTEETAMMLFPEVMTGMKARSGGESQVCPLKLCVAQIRRLRASSAAPAS